MIIGITGSIGSGKTTAAKMFSRHWYTRIDADEIGHELIKKDKSAYKEIVGIFGNGIIDKNGSIDRKKLGDLVFNDHKKLKKLNSILHPFIIKEIKNQIEKIKNKCGAEAKIIIDAPLLLETGAKNLSDKIIILKSDKKNAIGRLKKTHPKGKIEKILNAQMPLKDKLKYADFVIENNKDLKHLEKQVEKIIQLLEKNK